MNAFLRFVSIADIALFQSFVCMYVIGMQQQHALQQQLLRPSCCRSFTNCVSMQLIKALRLQKADTLGAQSESGGGQLFCRVCRGQSARLGKHLRWLLQSRVVWRRWALFHLLDRCLATLLWKLQQPLQLWQLLASHRHSDMAGVSS